MRAKIFLIFTILISFATLPADAGEVQSDMLVSTEWLEQNLNNPDVVILHVTWSPKSYDTGHIAGAQLVPWNDVAVTRDGITNEVPSIEAFTAMVRRVGIDENDRIILYDDGEGLVATRAYVVFDYFNLGDRTALLDGLWKKWHAEGRPTSTDIPSVIPSSYEPQARPEVIVDLAPLHDLVQGNTTAFDRPVVILDSRPEVDHTGSNTENKNVKRPGRIPESVNVYWKQTVESKENPVLKPIEKLRQLYEQAGVSRDNVVVTYCQSGVQAAHSYFTLKYLGYKPRLYDGSFIEWSAREDTPVDSGPVSAGKVATKE